MRGGWALAWVAKRSCGYPIPRGAQDQVTWVSEQPGIEKSVPAHGREIGTG